MKTKVQYQRRHIDEFIKLRCAGDLLERRLFPNAKEITESMATYNAVREYVLPNAGFDYGDSDVAVVSVGDGVVPRTAGLFAMRSAWHCFSIDPKMREKDYRIKRLIHFKLKIEEWKYDFCAYSHVVILLVHSHATVKNTLRHIMSSQRDTCFHLVAMPCCVPQDIVNKSCVYYRDTGVWSPKNEIKVWVDVK